MTDPAAPPPAAGPRGDGQSTDADQPQPQTQPQDAALAQSHAEMEPFWSAARAASEPTIDRIWKRLPTFPSPALRVQRVNQLDAELLDEELVGLLLEPVKTALSNIKATLPSDLEPELLLVLRLVLYKLSIWDHGATYGAMIQNLKYRNEWAHRGGLQSTSRDIPLSTLQLSLYPLLTILLPWAHTRAERSMTSHSFSDMPSNDPRRLLWAGLDRAQKVWAAAALLNFAIFLGDGKYRTLVDRVLGMRLTYARRAMNRNVSFEFLNRQLVWHAFTEFLLFLLPLIRPRRILRRLTKLPTHPKLLSFLLRFLPNVVTERFLGILPAPQGQSKPVLASNGFMAQVSRLTSRGQSMDENKKGIYADLPKGCCAICWQRLEREAGVSTSGGVAGSAAAAASLTGASAAFGALGMPSADPLDPTSRFTSGTARVGARRQRPRAMQGSQQALANRALKGIKTAARRDRAKRRKARLAERQQRRNARSSGSVSGTEAEHSSSESSDEEDDEDEKKETNEDDREEALMLGGVSSTGLRYSDAALFVPYAAQPCGCQYCYFCLTERLLGEEAGEELEDEGGWECLRCATRVRGAARAVAPEEEGGEDAGATDGDDGDDDHQQPPPSGPGVGPEDDQDGSGPGPSSGGGGGDDLFDNDDDDEVFDFSTDGAGGAQQHRANAAVEAETSEDDDGPPTPSDEFGPRGSHGGGGGNITINPSNLPPFLRSTRAFSLKNDDLILHEEAAALAIRTPTRRMSAVGPRGERERLFITTSASTPTPSSNPASNLARTRHVSQVGSGFTSASSMPHHHHHHLAAPASASIPAGVSGSHVVVPPLNFDVVAAGVYRSGHPNERNFDFMQRLGLRSIMYLANEDYRDNVAGWARASGLQIFHFPLEVNKEPFAEMDAGHVANALSAVADKRNLPMLIHCNKGKYRVGCLVGCLRRLQGWSHTSIFEEFARFAGNNKIADQEFIEVFNLNTVAIDPENKPEWLT
ncbi:peroxisome assembly protein (Peroxin-2) [Tilletia horrida]|nr:peroxisome assembly protein (Peroxin-2) [Tilletia horrida]